MNSCRSKRTRTSTSRVLYAALVGPFTAPRRNFSQRKRHDDIFLVDDVMFLYCFCLIVYGWRRVAATGGGNNNNNQSADDEWIAK